jgi:lipopolysaccharide/colanic/teichoic acid biosynthesis glycosyltransferase
MYKHFFKRFFDLIISLVALIVLSPFLIAITIWLHFANKGAGAFFYQTRIGMSEEPFRIIKFKSMTDERDENDKLLPDAKRLTKLGRFVRSTSIDELPQLINILKGDMGFIGPRPLPPIYLPYYTPEEAHRHDVRPGISGWAQVNGRKNITWSDKLECDVYYVNHCTFAMDLKIFFLTIKNVLKREGVGVENSGNVSLFDTRGIQRAELIQYDPNSTNRPTNTNIR